MNLEHTRRTYEKLGQEDPLYAVLTAERYRHNRWDVHEFLATGESEIAEVFESLDRLAVPVTRGRALDFGCGVGRLTQALATRFTAVVGVDIAESMVAKARELNTHGASVQYFANTVDNLQLLDSQSVDFVYSSISLQHVPPPANANYVAEFLRVLRPGGVAVFQVPNGREVRVGSWQEALYRFRYQYLRRAWKLVRGKPPYEMHYIPRRIVEQIVSTHGARLIHVMPVGAGRPDSNYRYYVGKR